MLRLLRGLVDDAGQSTVMVTHDPAAAAYADRVVFLADGAVVGELAAPTARTVAAMMADLEAAADADADAPAFDTDAPAPAAQSHHTSADVLKGEVR